MREGKKENNNAFFFPRLAIKSQRIYGNRSRHTQRPVPSAAGQPRLQPAPRRAPPGGGEGKGKGKGSEWKGKEKGRGRGRRAPAAAAGPRRRSALPRPAGGARLPRSSSPAPGGAPPGSRSPAGVGGPAAPRGSPLLPGQPDCGCWRLPALPRLCCAWPLGSCHASRFAPCDRPGLLPQNFNSFCDGSARGPLLCKLASSAKRIIFSLLLPVPHRLGTAASLSWAASKLASFPAVSQGAN